MIRTLRVGALTAAAGALMLALSGCLGGAVATTPTPAATADPSTAPTPSAEEALDAVTTVVVKPDGVQLTDPSGSVSVTLDYLAEPADAVDALTEVLDAEPVIESHEGSSHFPPSTSYSWDGFVLWEQLPVEGLEGVETSLIHPRFLVQATAADHHDEPLGVLRSVCGLRRGRRRSRRTHEGERRLPVHRGPRGDRRHRRTGARLRGGLRLTDPAPRPHPRASWAGASASQTPTAHAEVDSGSACSESRNAQSP